MQILEKAKKKKKMASSYESLSQSISRSQSSANMNNLIAGGGTGTQRFQRNSVGSFVANHTVHTGHHNSSQSNMLIGNNNWNSFHFCFCSFAYFFKSRHILFILFYLFSSILFYLEVLRFTFILYILRFEIFNSFLL